MPCSKIIEVIQPEFRTEFCSLIERCADISKAVGKGYDEKVYCHCLCIELQSQGIRHNYGTPRFVKYKEQIVGSDTGEDMVEYECLPFIVMVKAIDGEVDENDVWRLVRRMEQHGKAYGVVVQFTQGAGVPLGISVITHCISTYTLYDGVTGEAKTLRDYKEE